VPKIIKVQQCLLELQRKMSGVFFLRHSVLVIFFWLKFTSSLLFLDWKISYNSQTVFRCLHNAYTVSCYVTVKFTGMSSLQAYVLAKLYWTLSTVTFAKYTAHQIFFTALAFDSPTWLTGTAYDKRFWNHSIWCDRQKRTIAVSGRAQAHIMPKDASQSLPCSGTWE